MCSNIIPRRGTLNAAHYSAADKLSDVGGPREPSTNFGKLLRGNREKLCRCVMICRGYIRGYIDMSISV